MKRLLATTAVILGIGLATPASAAIYGVIVGIDAYLNVSSLDGAVNDANDIADALSGHGAEITLLTDDLATRANIMGALEDAVMRAGPGDLIVFSYAGHGFQQPEALLGDETDGKDEEFVLYGFAQSGLGAQERIRDNDIADLLSRVHPQAEVLMVADSCHSGTMTRGGDPRGRLGKTRAIEDYPIDDDPLAPPPVETRQVEVSQFPNVVFAAAARDYEETPEVIIDGESRGALSWSVAQALRGAANGGQGVADLADFRGYIRAQVRAWSEARQTPDVEFADTATRASSRSVLATLLSGETVVASPGTVSDSGASTVQVALDLAPPPKLFVTGGEGRSDLRDQLSMSVDFASAQTDADMVWDVSRQQLVDSRSADMVAEVPDTTAVDAAALKWRAVQALNRWSPQRAVNFRLDPGDGRHRLGTQVWLEVEQPAPGFDYVTLVNLASGGEVQMVFPGPATIQSNRDRFSPGQTLRRFGPSVVTDPVGADHVLAIVSRQRPDRLHAELAALDGKPAPDSLIDLLARYASDRDQVRVGVLPIFTER